jgi:hypothetical protein
MLTLTATEARVRLFKLIDRVVATQYLGCGNLLLKDWKHPSKNVLMRLSGDMARCFYQATLQIRAVLTYNIG